MALHCDCHVLAFAPLSGKHKFPPLTLKKLKLDSYDDYSASSLISCRNSCSQVLEKQMNVENLNALLSAYTQNLIETNTLGYNCTGLTTVKFPVRVKAKLGNLSLGNVADEIHVINHEQICF
jgi:hypothetical protein